MDIGLYPVQFAQQDRFGLHRITSVDEVLGGADRQVVHHFQAAGDDPGGDDVGYRSPGLVHRIETGQQHLGDLGPGQQFDRHFGDHPQQTFGTGEQRQQVQARRVQGFAAEGQALAFDGEDFQLQQVVHRQTVLEAVHAAGIFRDVAADGTGDLRRGIRRVIQAERRRRLGDRQVAHTGLKACRCGRRGRCAGSG